MIIAKGFLKSQNLLMLIKKDSVTSQKLGSRNILPIAKSDLKNDKSTVLLLINVMMCFFTSNRAKLFALNFSRDFHFDESGICLSAFSPWTNLKMCNIYVTPKLVKRVMTSIDSSKASGFDCFPVVVLKN